MNVKRIAVIRTDFPEKFGIPRQSGLVRETVGRIEFEPPYNDERAIKGLKGFEYLWLLWRFNVPQSEEPRLTVRPPRLGGQEEAGVFATRSPFRPNPIGLSSVRLLRIEHTGHGPVLYVGGADLRDQTEILDIKPYLPFTDSHPEAKAGFTEEREFPELAVKFPDELLRLIPEEKQHAAVELLRQDPRPAYERSLDKTWGISFAGCNIRFIVESGNLTVTSVTLNK